MYPCLDPQISFIGVCPLVRGNGQLRRRCFFGNRRATQRCRGTLRGLVTPNGGGPGGTIVPMSLNTSSGALTALSPVVGPGNAVKIVVDSSRTSLYSSDFNTGMLYAYSIHPASGNLTPS